MKHRWCFLLLVALVPLATACSKVDGAESTYKDPATLSEAPDGGERVQVTFTARAVERIGIETTPLTSGPDGLVVPYSAVLYDPDGSTWVFIQVKDRTYHRVPITVTDIRGEQVLLSSGPAPGSPVVAVGVAELFGAEHELGAH